MGNKAIIDKQHILDAAFSLACDEGLEHVNMRSVANACGVSVGSLYNYFPTKADLVSEVVALYWHDAIPAKAMIALDGEGFVDFCRRLSNELHEAVTDFQETWLVQLAALDKKASTPAFARKSATSSTSKTALPTSSCAIRASTRGSSRKTAL